MKKIIASTLILFCAGAGFAQNTAVKDVILSLNKRNRYSRSPTVCPDFKSQNCHRIPNQQFRGFPRFSLDCSEQSARQLGSRNREGKHTVFVRFRNAEGTVSRVFKRKIILDTTPPEIGKLRIVAAADPKKP